MNDFCVIFSPTLLRKKLVFTFLISVGHLKDNCIRVVSLLAVIVPSRKGLRKDNIGSKVAMQVKKKHMSSSFEHFLDLCQVQECCSKPRVQTREGLLKRKDQYK
jgi:hypothetical protein